ncbi:MAG: CRISPR-associated protein Csx19 [Bacillota bacterium]|nr:CRISPR-associated protein Csx19 [Bacillota bacterium]
MFELLKNTVEMNHMDFAWIMIYFTDKVVVGKYKKNELIFPTNELEKEKCVEVHIFNKEKELRADQSFEFQEIKTFKDYFFSEDFFILGKDNQEEKEINGHTFTTFKQNGREITLPVKKDNNGYRLEVHHLFDQETGNMSGYRLVDIKEGD